MKTATRDKERGTLHNNKRSIQQEHIVNSFYIVNIFALNIETPECINIQGDPTSPFWRRSALGFLWKKWCWSWNSSTLATSCEELTHWKRLWCREGLWAGGEGDDRGWDGWMASLTRWTWVWVNSGSWWRTGRPGVLRFMGSQRVRHDWVTELNWLNSYASLKSQHKCQLLHRNSSFSSQLFAAKVLSIS